MMLYTWDELCSLTMSSCSVRCTPNFFSPIVRSLTQMPPSPFTSRTWNSTFSLCSCSGPPHMSHGCADWPGSDCQPAATGCRMTGLEGEDEEGSSACPPPPPGSTPGWVSVDRHWQNTSLSKGGINEPCWCIGQWADTPLTAVLTVCELKSKSTWGYCYSCDYHVTCPSIWAGILLKGKNCQQPVHLQTRLFTTRELEMNKGLHTHFT